MDGLAELLSLLSAKGRRVYVVEKEVDLRDLGPRNTVYVLQLPDGSTAAGGRGGGFGERRIVKVYHYELGGGECRKAVPGLKLFQNFLGMVVLHPALN